MATFETAGGVSIYYEEHGSGYPILLLAPGGMNSTIPWWERVPYHPIRTFAGDFRLIAMDQRNAGKSRAPISASDGWDSYAHDQLALLDHLGIKRCLTIGNCIGCSFALNLVRLAPERIAGAVLQQPIGDCNNRDKFRENFDNWFNELKKTSPELAQTPTATLNSYFNHMFGGEFVYTITPEFARTIQTPLLLLMGNDQFHPEPISRQLASLAPNIEMVTEWKTPEAVGPAVARVTAFLSAHAN